MIPTKHRMDELWAELKEWPVGNRMAFALQLAHLTMLEGGSDLLDAGMFDSAADTDVYLLASRGRATEAVKAFARRLAAEHGDRRTLKAGTGRTPFSEPSIEAFAEPAAPADTTGGTQP